MEVFYLSHPHQIKKATSSAMALGFFDGIHLGHQKVIHTTKEIARKKGLFSALMTFDPHPAVVLGHQKHPKYLTPLKMKEQLIDALGIDILYVVEFSPSFSKLAPAQFVDDYIANLSVRHVVAGFDFTYGHKGSGTMSTLISDARSRFETAVVPKLTKDGKKVSSTAIRRMIQHGKVDEANALLGRSYETRGMVVQGEKRGRTIGFPTANIEEEDDFFIPDTGIYAVKMNVQNTWLDGVASIGFKPTFHDDFGEKPTVEVHLFDFDEDIYGARVSVEWHKKLRDEKKFNSVQSLVEQMRRDCMVAKTWLF